MRSASREAVRCRHGILTNAGDAIGSNLFYLTGGAGYEAMLTNNLSLKAEYLYIGMPADTMPYSALTYNYIYGFADDVQIARIGLNYKFGGGSIYQPLK